MPRFVDYFAIIGINEDKNANIKEGDELVPCVLHMTPQVEWKDFCFPPGFTKFCFPGRYEPVTECPRPTFFSDVLTDVDGNRCHCAILLFYERTDPKMNLFIPKALAIVSQYAYISNYKDILAAIFDNLRNGSINRNLSNAENYIFQIIYNQHCPEPGSPKFSISLGSNRSTVYPPISPTIPATDESVATLLELVGIDRLTKLFGALLTDNRIVFLSKSYTYLDKCTHALISLIYPIKYKFVYIPILPKDLIDIIGAPSPLIVGVQSLCDLELSDLDHILIMNLDTGLLIHENLCSPLIPQAYSTQIQRLLVKIALPQISLIDQVYYTKMHVDRRIIDKRVRACFFYLLMKLMAGYRPCITYARLVPTPIVRFHPDLFMNRRGTNG
ncbi:hypothetical protein MXB_783 [Myxobolus squamalis]|nr:hypothetical protein MXB_783 [Myxobolus squamalis]